MADQRQEILERGSYFPGDWVRPRYNPGTWMAMVDVAEIFTGHRSMTSDGRYEMFDGPLGVQLRIEAANQSETFLKPEREWETGYFGPSHIWNEDGRLHMFYSAGGDRSCYAVSDDGYNWERPVLGHTEFNGSTENNILKTPIPGSIFEDPSAPAAERYKMLEAQGYWKDRDTGEEVGGSEELDGGEADKCWRAEQYEGDAYTGRKVVLKGRLMGWYSPDRFTWTKIDEPLAHYSVNGGICPGYDEHNNDYFAFIQPQGCAPVEPQSLGTSIPETEVVRRAVGITRTKDFRTWPAAKLLIHPDAQDPLDISYYGACYFAYPGRQDLHAMFLPVFHQITDTVDTQVAFSRDGIVWTRPERRSIMSLGAHGSGEEAQMHIWRNGLVELPDGNWAVPYQGNSKLHTVDGDEYQRAIFPDAQPTQNRWARWRPHRLCGVEADNEGSFTIPTVFRCDNELRLNYRCAPGGWIKIELLPYIPTMLCPDANPLKGYSFAECDRLAGDEEDQVVTWKGQSDISGVGEMAAIRVQMFQAKLFAYRL